jgi:ADP-ribosylation factor-like protein 1
MGKEISKFSQKICVRTGFYKVLILGLEGTGKTTLFDRLKSNEVYITNPTIGFNVEQIKLDSQIVTLWDFGGHEKIMNLWDRYFDNTDLVILVLDSTDSDSWEKIQNILKIIKEKLSNIYLLILINKIDLNGTQSNEYIIEKCELYKYDLKIAKVLRTSLVRGDGLKEVTKTMTNLLQNNNYIKL